MPKGRKAVKEEEVVIKPESIASVDISCQTEEWTEDRMIKYRKMKRKLMELIAVNSTPPLYIYVLTTL